ncbi:hypothetical protein [Streptomyces sp. CAU 1734]|uniref:hypothetical protein n=1 Tax=Streptomyces sp. CAU 1734 TaxID=3140360 RepID=UPI00326187C3
MSKSAWKRAGVCLTAVAVVAGIAGCGGEAADKKAADKGAGKGEDRSVTQVLTSAYKKTSEARTAKVEMDMKMSGKMATEAGGSDMKMSGVMGWDPTVMDMTITGGALKSQGGPEQSRMVWLDNVMYMDMGAKSAKDMDGKRWMKMDIAGMAEMSGDKALQKQMTGSLESMNQDPASQLAMLLESPGVKHVGEETIGGVRTQHYTGKISVKEMISSNKSLDTFSKEDRAKLLDGIKKSGINGFDTEVWVNEDDYPVKMDVDIDSPDGKMTMVMTYTDYGVKAAVKAPPAGETFDLMEMLKELQGMGDEMKASGLG